MQKAKYLKAFQELAAHGADTFILNGDEIIVEVLPPEEVKTASGLILSTGKETNNEVLGLDDHRLILCVVLLTGVGYFDETDPTKTIPLDIKPGDIVAISSNALNRKSIFGDLESYEPFRIAFSRAEAIRWRFYGEEAYNRAFAILNEFNPKSIGRTS